MKVQLDVDRSHEETSVTIHCKEVDDSIKNMLDYLNHKEAEFIVGREGEKQHMLNPKEVHYFYTKNEAVIAATSKGMFLVREKLYELEQTLPSGKFIRISKSVVANLYEISHFEPSFNGTLGVFFKSGAKEYASRHYVSKIKEVLKMNRRDRK
ncbi:LytTR family DNA-binding domain-containing protein [Halobacillus sp. B23F22_1]|uniref:LytTR family DNA-binding domain-containing protein n=1 Tax=Halobacillus sp. B23F22_1 TaxID=3459514 RepID=UPI00373F8974